MKMLKIDGWLVWDEDRLWLRFADEEWADLGTPEYLGPKMAPAAQARALEERLQSHVEENMRKLVP